MPLSIVLFFLWSGGPLEYPLASEKILAQAIPDAAATTEDLDSSEIGSRHLPNVGFPRLSEEQAKQIAADLPSVAAILKNHSELERHISLDTDSRIWTVLWTLPGSFRSLIEVQIRDTDSAIVSTSIESEAYFDIIPSLSEEESIELARNQERVREQLEGREVDESATYGSDMVWTVSFYDGPDQLAQVLVDDGTGTVDEVMVGPQIAWQMARGYRGAFGRIVNEPYVWLPLCVLFLVPFVNIRNPFRLIHLDLLVLLSFSVSHYYFNRGDISTSVPLAYPPLVYLLFRLGLIAARRVRHHRPDEETHLHAVRIEQGGEERGSAAEAGASMPHINFRPAILLAGIIALIVFRLIINIADSNVVDVGYSGVAGAHTILEGQTPYGHMPSDNSNGDTYGPLNYLLYVPFERVLPWSGQWDDLPAAHAAAIFFDLLTVAGMFMAGRQLMKHHRQGGNRLGLALAYGWVAYPYTTFVQNCNVNDAIVAAFLVWGFVFLRVAPLAGALLGFATQIKFFPAVLGPLWASFPRSFRGWGRRALFVAAFILAAAVTLPVIFLGDGTMQTFWERSLKWQIGRDSPFSIWGQYPEQLAQAQRIGQYVLVALALASYFWPPRKTMVQVAAGSAALLVGFEIVQTHWFYLYIPWFFPLALIAILTWRPAGIRKRREISEALEPDARQV